MFADLKWLTFPERVLYQKAIQMFKTIRENAPEYLRTALTLLPIFIQYFYVHHLASNCILQKLGFASENL